MKHIPKVEIVVQGGVAILTRKTRGVEVRIIDKDLPEEEGRNPQTYSVNVSVG